MNRISSLILTTGLAILPIGAFAQQTATPAPMTKPAATAAQTAKTPAPGVKPTVSMKDSKSTHAKLNTATPAVPAKTTEPGKS
jgi:hypothetical protein